MDDKRWKLFGPAFTVAGAAFFLAAIALYWVPEPRSVELT